MLELVHHHLVVHLFISELILQHLLFILVPGLFLTHSALPLLNHAVVPPIRSFLFLTQSVLEPFFLHLIEILQLRQTLLTARLHRPALLRILILQFLHFLLQTAHFQFVPGFGLLHHSQLSGVLIAHSPFQLAAQLLQLLHLLMQSLHIFRVIAFRHLELQINLIIALGQQLHALLQRALRHLMLLQHLSQRLRMLLLFLSQ